VLEDDANSEGNARATVHAVVRERMMDATLRLLLVAGLLQLPAALAGTGFGPLLLVPLPFVLQYAACLYLVRRGRSSWAAGLFVVTTLAALPVLLGLTHGANGYGAPFVLVSALISVSWLPPRPAVLSVLAHFAVLAASPWWEGMLGSVLPPGSLPVTDGGLLVTWGLATTLSVLLVGGAVDTLLAARREADARLSESNAALEAARASSARKARFLATMSHELRTPLTAILGYAGILRDDAIRGESDLQCIEAAGGQLLVLVEDLLELSRAESTRETRRDEVDVGDVLRECQDRVRLVVHGVDPIGVITDRAQLRRVLRNLVGHVATPGEVANVYLRPTPETLQLELACSGRHRPSLPEAGVAYAVSQRLARTLGATIRPTTLGAVVVLPRVAS
jgi:signal transduction histidine kinase